ncbi:hypothetical protein LF1_41180 [Rubripirellula obstinata]|uniref:Uncharacterized protein n=1 Tax=Rubripirellula obstinata TaxID=406547 RepID=A0A5B1CKH9_9BACT|nr:hypothetical protein [Rubripirellula obstinata]KAA1261568.1 hypothetical protein LF1_41180 [Rubripirellula obstinata]
MTSRDNVVTEKKKLVSVRVDCNKTVDEAVKIIAGRYKKLRIATQGRYPESPRTLLSDPMDDQWLKTKQGFDSGMRIFSSAAPWDENLLAKWLQFIQKNSQDFRSTTSSKLDIQHRADDVYCRGKTYASFEQWFTRDDGPSIGLTMSLGYWGISIFPSALRYPSSKQYGKARFKPPADLLDHFAAWSEGGLEVHSADGTSKVSGLTGSEALKQLNAGWRSISGESASMDDAFAQNLNDYANQTGEVRADLSVNLAKADRWFGPILTEHWGRPFSSWTHTEKYKPDLNLDDLTTEQWTRFPLATNDTRNGLDIQVDLLVRGDQRYYDVQGTDEATVMETARAVGTNPELYQGDDPFQRWIE